MSETAEHAALRRLFEISEKLVVAAVRLVLDNPNEVPQKISAAQRAVEKAAAMQFLTTDNLEHQYATNFASLGEEQLLQGAERLQDDSSQKQDAKAGVKTLDADVIRVFRTGPKGKQITRYVWVIEIQTAYSGGKDINWLMHFAQLLAFVRREGYPNCEVDILVVTLNESVATWADNGIQRERLQFTPYVLSPRNIPKVTDEADAIANPGLAVLSTAANPDSPQIVQAATIALKQMPQHLRAE